MNHCRPPQNWSLECGAVQIAARQKSSQTTDGQHLIRFYKVLYRTLVSSNIRLKSLGATSFKSRPVSSQRRNHLNVTQGPLNLFPSRLLTFGGTILRVGSMPIQFILRAISSEPGSGLFPPTPITASKR